MFIKNLNKWNVIIYDWFVVIKYNYIYIWIVCIDFIYDWFRVFYDKLKLINII